MNYREFYIWLEGYLDGKLEDKNIPVLPIIEKMNQVISDEQKWINDFKRYRNTSNQNSIEIKNPSE
jgi:hypothetical protein